MQELQAQAYAFAAKLRQFEDEKCEELEELKRQYEATRAATETIHRAETSQVSPVSYPSDSAEIQWERDNSNVATNMNQVLLQLELV